MPRVQSSGLNSMGQPSPGFLRMLPWSLVALAVLQAIYVPPLRDLDATAVVLLLAGLGVAALLWPSLDERDVAGRRGRLVAIVGCDGSGKSTITEDLCRELSTTVAVRTCYLGLGSGAIGERIKRWPLIGAALERKLARKAGQTRTKGQRIPGLPTALVVYGFSLLRLRRFKRMLRLRGEGFVVLTDRYPQTECPGFYDGPGLSAAAASGWAVAALARSEKRLYAWMASFRPDVVIRLNVDADTAAARKPDHRADLLQQKVAVTSSLRFNGARIVDLDATEPYLAVRTAASRIVSATLAAAA